MFFSINSPISRIANHEEILYLYPTDENKAHLDRYLSQWSVNVHKSRDCSYIRIMRSHKPDALVPATEINNFAKVFFQNRTLIWEMAETGRASMMSLFQKISDEELVKTLISTTNYQLQTPLHVAVEHQQSTAVRLLLEKRANSYARDLAQRTPFDAASRERQKKYQRLLEKRNDPSEAGYLINRVAKYLRASGYDPRIVAQWEEKKWEWVNCEKASQGCHTPLGVFAHQKSVEIMKMFKPYDANRKQEVERQDEGECLILVNDTEWMMNTAWAQVMQHQQANPHDPKKDEVDSTVETIDVPFKAQIEDIANDISGSEIDSLTLNGFEDLLEEELDGNKNIDQFDSLNAHTRKRMFDYLKKYKVQTTQCKQKENSDHSTGNYGPIRHGHDHKHARLVPCSTQRDLLRCYPDLNEVSNVMFNALSSYLNNSPE